MNFIRARRTFMMPLPRTGVPHLWIVLTDPDPVTGKVVAVMVVSEKSTTDKTTTLDAGDHPFIQHPSNLDYGGAKSFDVARLENEIRTVNHALREDLSVQLFEKVRKGLYASSNTIEWMKTYCRAHFDEDGKTIIGSLKKT